MTFTVTRAKSCPAPITGVEQLPRSSDHAAIIRRGMVDIAADRAARLADYVSDHEFAVESLVREHHRRAGVLILLHEAAKRSLAAVSALYPSVEAAKEDQLFKHTVGAWKSFIANAEVHFAAYDLQTGRAEGSIYCQKLRPDVNGVIAVPVVATHIPASQSSIEIISSQGMWFGGAMGLPFRHPVPAPVISDAGEYLFPTGAFPFTYTNHVVATRQDVQQQTLAALAWIKSQPEGSLFLPTVVEVIAPEAEADQTSPSEPAATPAVVDTDDIELALPIAHSSCTAVLIAKDEDGLSCHTNEDSRPLTADSELTDETEADLLADGDAFADEEFGMSFRDVVVVA